MKGCTLLVIMLCLYSCHGVDSIKPSGPNSTIYLAGQVEDAAYWKNGVYTSLSPDRFAIVQTMSVDDSTVLIGGWTLDGNVIWKNGEPSLVNTQFAGVTLVAAHNNKIYGAWPAPNWVLSKNGIVTPIDNTGYPTGIAMLGDDAYLSGASHGNEYQWGVSSFYPLDAYAILYKNEHIIFKETVYSHATSIFINGNDIYLGGYLGHYPSLQVVACYWKNGQRFALTSESHDAWVTSLFVNDKHVYAAGVMDDHAVFWKDSTLTSLSEESSIANSISVLGADVYIAGKENEHPVVWKNGVKQYILNQQRLGEIKVVIAVKN